MGASSRDPTPIPGSVQAYLLEGVPSKTPTCFQPLETSAQRTLLLYGSLVIGTQICSRTQEELQCTTNLSG